MPRRRRAGTRYPSLVLGLASCGSTAAWADQSPYYLGASQGITHQSNVFQTTANPQRDDVSTTGLLGGLDLQLGRQRVYADGSMQTNRYRQFGQLDNLGYELATGLDWSTVEHLSGNLRYTTNQSLVNYADVLFPLGIRDVQKTQQLSTTARHGIGTGLGLEGSIERRSVNYSAVQDQRGYQQHVGSLGVRWGGAGLLNVGAALRLTKSDFPSALLMPPTAAVPATPTTPAVPAMPAVYGPDQSNRRDIDLTGSWSPSGLSTLAARLSLTRETHTQAAAAKLSGTTGSVSWTYRASAKSLLTATLTRDTGTETTFSAQPSNLTAVRATNDQLNTVAEVAAEYRATPKILVKASFHRVDGSILNSSDGVVDASTRSMALDVTYAANRGLDFTCKIGVESRLQAYTATTIGCTARVTLR